MTKSDKQILFELAEAVRNSGDAPTLECEFDPNDPEACEAVLYEADCAVGHFMASPRWDGLRYRLSDPDLYDEFTLDYRVNVRKQLLAIIADAQGIIVQEAINRLVDAQFKKNCDRLEKLDAADAQRVVAPVKEKGTRKKR